MPLADFNIGGGFQRINVNEHECNVTLIERNMRQVKGTVIMQTISWGKLNKAVEKCKRSMHFF